MLFYIYYCFFIALGAAYANINGFYILAWRAKIRRQNPLKNLPQNPPQNPPQNLPQNLGLPTVAVVVVARDEQARIAQLLDALLAQDYPQEKLQIIIVDDHSSDDTTKTVTQYAEKYPHFRLLHLRDYLDAQARQKTIAFKIIAFKKKAIAYALSQSQSEWIVCTDADGYMPTGWLSALISAGETPIDNIKPKAVLAPVIFEEDADAPFILRRFQQLDLLGMMVITAIGVDFGAHLANGANLAYRRAAYIAAGGFEGQEHLASGDDMLLLHKIAAQNNPQNNPQNSQEKATKNNPNNDIVFVLQPEAVVTTALKNTWSGLWQQRLRWATKSRTYQQKTLIFILATVWLFCFSILFLPFLFWLTADINYLYLLAYQVFIKIIFDFILLFSAAQFFRRSRWLYAFLPSVFLHWLYILAVGSLANLVKKYVWKGRRVQ
jgi:cellulose synthase/poly-beta-1,6-N-acetylglucosamine synthase-like glycosyltransferase